MNGRAGGCPPICPSIVSNVVHRRRQLVRFVRLVRRFVRHRTLAGRTDGQDEDP